VDGKFNPPLDIILIILLYHLIQIELHVHLVEKIRTTTPEVHYAEIIMMCELRMLLLV
jgi:hypothetical protein